MSQGWPKLKNPPVILAVFEIKYQVGSEFDVSVLKRNDDIIKEEFPIRLDNLKGNINLPSPTPGLSTAQVSSQHIGYIYQNQEKTKKIVISKDDFVFATEGSYPGWNEFKSNGLKCVGFFNHILKSAEINRVSIRFINLIKVKELDNPLDYFNTIISTKDGVIEYPVTSYFHKYVMAVPDSKIVVNVIQSLEEKQDSEFHFIFDIDVLDHDRFSYNLSKLDTILENIRNHKNSVFFKNLTEKTINLL